MTWLRRFPWFISAAITWMLILVAPGIVLGQSQGVPAAEPGYPAADGTWVIPVQATDDMTIPELDAADLVVMREDHPLKIKERVSFSFRGSDQATALMIVLNQPALGPKVIEAWVPPLGDVLDKGLTPGVLASLVQIGPQGTEFRRPGDRAMTTKEISEALSVPRSGRLWDGVLETIAVLSGPDLPDRRVVLLVSDGREDIPSEHVMVSCIEAAIRARVAVYILSLTEGAAADEARLRVLALRTGGQILNASTDLDGALGQMLGRISSARGLRLVPDSDPLPAEISITWGGKMEPGIPGLISRRQDLKARSDNRWLIVVCALLAGGGAGYLIWRQRSITVGVLMVQTKDGQKRFPVPAHGVTIGRDRDNSMVLANPSVSRHHAVIRVKDGRAIITDLRSAAGTRVNGEPIKTCQLSPGDRILVGRAVELVYQDRSSAE